MDKSDRKTGPRNVTEEKQLAIDLAKSGQFDRAHEVFAQICADSPDDAEAWMLLGAANGELGRLDAAIAGFRRAIALREGYADAHFNLGLCLLRRGDAPGEAAASLRRSIALGRRTDEAMDLFRNADFISTRERSMCVEVAGGISIHVPASLQLITPFVLLEQEDWFEKEIQFVRKWLRPGMQVVDIGANYGVYTLTMAACVGVSGQVWAFEPASATARHLRRSIGLNGFSHVHLVQAALSDRAGEARLALHLSPELNSLTSHDDTGAGSETVEVTTLDGCARRFDWPALDFIKLDAEGEEERILRGGHALLTAQSPVVMFEVRHRDHINLPLVNRFTELGYGLFRLVPGPCVLAPFDPDEPLDSHELNLFACKPDRAAKLAQDNLLAVRVFEPNSSAVRGAWMRQHASAAICSPSLRVVPSSHRAMDESYAAALDYYAYGCNEASSATARIGALAAALRAAEAAVAKRASLARLSSLARIAAESGRRGRAANVSKELREILDNLGARSDLAIDEPFLAPLERFDSIEPASGLRWLQAAAIEHFVRLSFHSSHYARRVHESLLDAYCPLGYPSPEMERRRQLVRLKYGLQEKPEVTAALISGNGAMRNAEFWNGNEAAGPQGAISGPGPGS